MMASIHPGEQKAFGHRHPDPLSSNFLCRLYKRMFGETRRIPGRTCART